MLKEEWEAEKHSDESIISHILAIHKKLEEMSEIVKDNMKEAQQQQKAWYDKTAALPIPWITSSSKWFSYVLSQCLHGGFHDL